MQYKYLTKKNREAEEKAAAEKERIEREQAEQAKLEEEKKKKKKPGNSGKEADKKSVAPNTTGGHPGGGKAQPKEQPIKEKSGNSQQHQPAPPNVQQHIPSINQASDRPHTRTDGSEDVDK